MDVELERAEGSSCQSCRVDLLAVHTRLVPMPAHGGPAVKHSVRAPRLCCVVHPTPALPASIPHATPPSVIFHTMQASFGPWTDISSP